MPFFVDLDDLVLHLRTMYGVTLLVSKFDQVCSIIGTNCVEDVPEVGSVHGSSLGEFVGEVSVEVDVVLQLMGNVLHC